ncbi:hypothetical protein, partial [Salmonella enterica]|uniref:hypothetical protein n=1 Tax=Salmonella enterica TaxID=28901 RepID=UPI00329893E5
MLIWNTLPTTNGQQANVAIGQPNLTTLTFAITATGLRQPRSVTVAPDGRVVVADTGNHRVL